MEVVVVKTPQFLQLFNNSKNIFNFRKRKRRGSRSVKLTNPTAESRHSFRQQNTEFVFKPRVSSVLRHRVIFIRFRPEERRIWIPNLDREEVICEETDQM